MNSRAWLTSLLSGLLLLAASSCAHNNDDDALPTLNMDARPLEAANEKPGSCTDEKKIERIKGGVPSGAVHVVEMTVKADRAVPFWMFEEAVRQRAAKYCCDGVSVLRALAEPGDALFTEVEATGWRRLAAAEGE